MSQKNQFFALLSSDAGSGSEAGSDSESGSGSESGDAEQPVLMGGGNLYNWAEEYTDKTCGNSFVLLSEDAHGFALISTWLYKVIPKYLAQQIMSDWGGSENFGDNPQPHSATIENKLVRGLYANTIFDKFRMNDKNKMRTQPIEEFDLAMLIKLKTFDVKFAVGRLVAKEKLPVNPRLNFRNPADVQRAFGKLDQGLIQLIGGIVSLKNAAYNPASEKVLVDLLGFRNETAHSGYELEERDVIWGALERHATDFADTVLTNKAIKQAYNDEWAVFRDRLKKDADRLSATFLQKLPLPVADPDI